MAVTLGLDALFRRYDPQLRRLCVRWTGGHRADAQDLLAEACLRAVAATVQGGAIPDNPMAWLSAIIGNLARDRLRAQRRKIGPLVEQDEVRASHRQSYDTLLTTREALHKTLEQVQRLCPTQRGALLARSAGEEYRTIAAQLGTSPANARKLVQTARTKLRVQLSLGDANR